ncbi:MAG: protein kinase [Pirellulales bacterium]
MDYIEGQTLAELILHLRRLEGLESEAPEDAERPVSNLADSLASGRFASQKSSSDPAPTAAYTHARTPGAAAETARVPQAALSTERSTKSPAYFRSIAELGVQVAETLDHAHENGVIHRDVKPSNVILDNSGKPWVTDFGLARIETNATLTVSGDLLGTIRYMSPEQALAKRIVVDHRTDVYSLGATLYELLTLQPVFSGQDRQELLRQVAFDEPKAPRKLSKAIPAELEIIVLKAMAKNPAERYDTAQQLADDLRRFLEDQPIRARRPSPIVHLVKWTRRHRPLVLMLTSSTLAVLLIALTVLGVSNSQIRHMLDQRNQAIADLQWAAYRHNVALAQREWLGNEITASEKALERCPRTYRGWEWHYVQNLLHLDAYTFHSHQGEALGMAFSPDSRHIALASSDGYVRVWDVLTKEALFAVHLPANEDPDYVSGEFHGNHLDFSPDGRRIAVGCLDG